MPVSADMQISEIMNMLLPPVQEKCMRVGGGGGEEGLIGWALALILFCLE